MPLGAHRLYYDANILCVVHLPRPVSLCAVGFCLPMLECSPFWHTTNMFRQLNLCGIAVTDPAVLASIQTVVTRCAVPSPLGSARENRCVSPSSPSRYGTLRIDIDKVATNYAPPSPMPVNLSP